MIAITVGRSLRVLTYILSTPDELCWVPHPSSQVEMQPRWNTTFIFRTGLAVLALFIEMNRAMGSAECQKQQCFGFVFENRDTEIWYGHAYLRWAGYNFLHVSPKQVEETSFRWSHIKRWTSWGRVVRFRGFLSKWANQYSIHGQTWLVVIYLGETKSRCEYQSRPW